MRVKGEQVRPSPQRCWEPFTCSPAVAAPLPPPPPSASGAPPKPTRMCLFWSFSHLSPAAPTDTRDTGANGKWKWDYCGAEVIHIVVPSLVHANVCVCVFGGGFELSLFIQHIDLMDSPARDAPEPPSAASVSGGGGASSGKRSSSNSNTLQLTKADNNDSCCSTMQRFWTEVQDGRFSLFCATKSNIVWIVQFVRECRFFF